MLEKKSNVMASFCVARALTAEETTSGMSIPSVSGSSMTTELNPFS